eukprot:1206139-Rhodomonas_salina.1
MDASVGSVCWYCSVLGSRARSRAGRFIASMVGAALDTRGERKRKPCASPVHFFLSGHLIPAPHLKKQRKSSGKRSEGRSASCEHSGGPSSVSMPSSGALPSHFKTPPAVPARRGIKLRRGGRSGGVAGSARPACGESMPSVRTAAPPLAALYTPKPNTRNRIFMYAMPACTMPVPRIIASHARSHSAILQYGRTAHPIAPYSKAVPRGGLRVCYACATRCAALIRSVARAGVFGRGM